MATRLVHMQPKEVATIMVRKYGREKALRLASNRRRDAMTEATSSFYASVLRSIRDNTWDGSQLGLDLV